MQNYFRPCIQVALLTKSSVLFAKNTIYQTFPYKIVIFVWAMPRLAVKNWWCRTSVQCSPVPLCLCAAYLLAVTLPCIPRAKVPSKQYFVQTFKQSLAQTSAAENLMSISTIFLSCRSSQRSQAQPAQKSWRPWYVPPRPALFLCVCLCASANYHLHTKKVAVWKHAGVICFSRRYIS